MGRSYGCGCVLETANRHVSCRKGHHWMAVAQWGGLALGLALCYLNSVPSLQITGLFLFSVLAMRRLDLALPFVPLTAPLFLVQLKLPGLPPHAVPPHELALFLICAAAAPHVLLSLLRARRRAGRGPTTDQGLALLFLLAGVLGIIFTAPEPVARQDALRAFRWFVIEPLIFVVLIYWLSWDRPLPPFESDVPIVRRLIVAFVAGGALVSLWGLVQFAAAVLAPHPFLPIMPLSFSVSVLNGLPRVTSVYGNPNNLGLYLGRVWPLAVALALIEWRMGVRRGLALAYALGAALCVGGILVSFSRGAWLGAGVALLVFVLPWIRRRFQSWMLPCLFVCCTTLAGVCGLIFTLRGSLAGGSANVRLLFWREALALIEQHPFGLGLDQFYYYHNPVFGRSLIDPALANTQDRTAHGPHTLVFELWLNLGPLGLLAVVWLLVRAVKRVGAVRAIEPVTPAVFLAQGAIAALAAALAHGLVDTFYFWPDLAIAFWLLLVLIRDGLNTCPQPSAVAGLPVAWRSFLPAQATIAHRRCDLIAAETVAAGKLGVSSDGRVAASTPASRRRNG
jgi:putative inorganic carbon (HCO3(-)) transporter